LHHRKEGNTLDSNSFTPSEIAPTAFAVYFMAPNMTEI